MWCFFRSMFSQNLAGLDVYRQKLWGNVLYQVSGEHYGKIHHFIAEKTHVISMAMVPIAM